jgi:hypothetical protein
MTGLRSAFAEIQNRPEALAAVRQIEEKQKAFDLKGQANAPVAASAFVQGAGAGGARVQAAYDAASRQAQPAEPQPAAPAFPPSPTPLPQPVPLAANRAATLSAYGRAAQYRP